MHAATRPPESQPADEVCWTPRATPWDAQPIRGAGKQWQDKAGTQCQRRSLRTKPWLWGIPRHVGSLNGVALATTAPSPVRRGPPNRRQHLAISRFGSQSVRGRCRNKAATKVRGLDR